MSYRNSDQLLAPPDAKGRRYVPGPELEAPALTALEKVEAERDALREEVQALRAEIDRMWRDAQQARFIAVVANEHGWSGTEDSKILSVHIGRQLDRLDELDAENAALRERVGMMRQREARVNEVLDTCGCQCDCGCDTVHDHSDACDVCVGCRVAKAMAGEGRQ